MTIAYWLNFHKQVRHPGMWDDSIVQWLLSPKPWSDDHAEAGELHQQGAIVIIPGRFHDHDLTRINGLMESEPWVVYVITADEENAFDVDRLGHRNRKIWVQTPKAGRHDHYGWLPVGWSPHTSLVELPPKTLDWFFAGQITHSRRQELAEVLRPMSGGKLIETKGFTQGVSPQQYIDYMASAKVVPCPSGPVTVDTFRLCEALEVGAIPIVETSTPTGFQAEYWTGMFGAHPLPVVESWFEFPDLLAEMLVGWPLRANAIGAWWIDWKRHLYRRFWQSVREVGG